MDTHTRVLEKVQLVKCGVSSANTVMGGEPGGSDDGEGPRIKRLEEHVVNRIAAGEVIQRPSSALKEMLENSLDAGSKSIGVTTKLGGMKLLQIQDTGHGISKADMTIVCERFTTSKLKKFEDLQEIQTFGFRGEALASISHVAHVTITSMQKGDACAHRGHYSDGLLVTENGGAGGAVQPCAGVQGTTISVEDLFFNMPARKAALKNTSDEFNRIVDVVTRYAVDNPHVAMSCKKAGSRAEVQTRGGKQSTSLDVIRTCYGNDVARDLAPLDVSLENIGLRVTGHISQQNYQSKKGVFVLFINKRSVDSATIKRSIEQVYESVLPRGSHPFVYLSMTLPTKSIDVNVHPTKREVHFLHEEEIISAIQDEVSRTLRGANESKNFSLGESGGLMRSTDEKKGDRPDSDGKQTLLGPDPGEKKTKSGSAVVDPRKFVRTTAKDGLGRMDAFTVKRRRLTCHCSAGGAFTGFKAGSPKDPCPVHDQDEGDDQFQDQGDEMKAELGGSKRGVGVGSVPNSLLARPITRLMYKPPMLTSVHELLESVEAGESKRLTEMVQKHTFVGMIDGRRMCAQYETQLILVDLVALTKAMFYQQTLRQFSHLPLARFDPPLDMKKLLEAYLGATEGDSDGRETQDGVKKKAKEVVELLVAKAPMVSEYFSICISDDGKLEALPQIVERFSPHIYNLPRFFLRLFDDVDWTREKECFDGIARALAALYTHDPDLYSIPTGDPSIEEEDAAKATTPEGLKPESELLTLVQHFVSPAMRAFLTVPKANGNSIMPIARLEQLYRVFERC